MAVGYVILTIFLFFIFTWEYLLALVGTIFKKKKKLFINRNNYSFITLVCAHNEESCINNILNDLIRQTYKNNSVYVVLDNCTDMTKAVVLKYPNIKYIEKNTVSSNKGAALNFAYDYLEKNKLLKDVVIILDADCHIDKNFIHKVNNSFNAGSMVVMPKTMAANPSDSIVSSWYTFYWDMVAEFSRKPHSNLNMSCNITGCGVAIRTDVLPRSQTITEDVEYFWQFIRDDIKIDYLENALVYQEQPMHIKDMFHQLYRWVCGIRQCNKLYLRSVLKSFLTKPSFNKFCGITNGLVCFSLGNYVAFLLILLFGGMVAKSLLSMLLLQFIILFIVTTLTSMILLFKRRYSFKKMGLGMISFLVFIIFLGIVYIYSIFIPSKKWTKIRRKGNYI